MRYGHQSDLDSNLVIVEVKRTETIGQGEPQHLASIGKLYLIIIPNASQICF